MCSIIRICCSSKNITCTFFLDQSPPRIVKQPPSDELLFQVNAPSVETGDVKPFIIECEAEGEPAPK